MNELLDYKKAKGAWAQDSTAVQVMRVAPGLCLPDFLRDKNIASLDPDILRELSACCERWSCELTCLYVQPGQERGLLLIFLPWEVESHIAEAWRRRPSHAYLLHNLAQSLCRAALGKFLPWLGEEGCAPLPELTPTEAEGLRRAASAAQTEASAASAPLPKDLAPSEQSSDAPVAPSLTANPSGRTYSLLTYYPYAGGCELCALRVGCPRLTGV